jgi:hypothetical protein
VRRHARISTTLEIYTDTADEAKRDALARLHGLFSRSQEGLTYLNTYRVGVV